MDARAGADRATAVEWPLSGSPDDLRPADRSLAAWVLALLFVLAVVPLLGGHGFDFGFDEGVLIAQAREIQQGRLPFADFFYHQPPLYPFMLALVSMPAPDSILAYRLPSVLATAATGVLLWGMARRFVPGPWALLAPLLFYTAPLQFFGLVAMPNALFVATSTAGVYLLYFGEKLGDWRRDSAAAVLLAVAVLIKPLAISTALAAGIVLFATSRGARRAAVVASVGLATGLFAWAIFDWLGDGGFSEILAMQLGRYAARGGFELFRNFSPIQQSLAHLSLDSALAFNIHELWRTFIQLRSSSQVQLTLPAVLGFAVVLAGRGLPSPRGSRLLIAIWLILPIVFGVFVWEPSWEHYFLQYLPAIALLATIGLAGLWRVPRLRLVARAVAACVVLAALASGALAMNDRRTNYARAPEPKSSGEHWLTFNPFLNLLSGTVPACGLIDPFNTYGKLSLLGGMLESEEAALPERWKTFYFSEAELRACLEADPEIRIGLGYWAGFFVDEEMQRFLDGLPPERFESMPAFIPGVPAQELDDRG